MKYHTDNYDGNFIDRLGTTIIFSHAKLIG